MALITCPECGERISDKAAICIHCGFPLENYVQPHGYMCNINGKEYDIACVKKDYYSLGILEKEQLTLILKAEYDFLIDKSSLDKLYKKINYYKLSEYDPVKISHHTAYAFYRHFRDSVHLDSASSGKLLLDLIKCDFNYIKFDSSKCINDKIKYESVAKCPKCGSTSIQVVRKNWGVVFGFMTNATERVCAKCNYRW